MDDSGDRYYTRSEIDVYLQLNRRSLYKKYPVLWRKVATLEDKGMLRQIVLSQASVVVMVWFNYVLVDMQSTPPYHCCSVFAQSAKDLVLAAFWAGNTVLVDVRCDCCIA
ncbi:unnamed protein product [Nippostrongylus brasiliensis]|uniref:HTH merR-type domain-containing protein n=1 Tax=Nippostrongylus brasiliensis TaxID=27835 RepID=A0A0N4YNE8_NIPBR|nr:unnamed protein product [Nippostrongylus brasiliensis]